jgi:cytoskeleton protein RodZ
MESYGTILRKAREEKNIDIETVARDTSITPQYIQGLESEDPSAFPGEPYMVGFLRNYAEYLGVDPASVLSLYHSKEIQESPVPEGLLVKQRPPFFIPLVVGISIAAAVIIACTVLFIIKRKSSAEDQSIVISKRTQPHKYELSDAPFTGRLYRKDQIVVPTRKGKVILTVKDTLSSFGLDTPAGVLYTDLAEESEEDIDGDTIPDIIVYVSDISSTDETRGAEVRLLLKHDEEAPSVQTSVDESAITTSDDSQMKHKQQVILEDTRAYPFTINASFRGACTFRYKIDHKTSEENYFASGDIVTMTANNGIRLWMSNCNTVKYNIIADTRSFDLDIGKAGQVLVEDIKWVKNLDGKYQLVVVELD